MSLLANERAIKGQLPCQGFPSAAQLVASTPTLKCLTMSSPTTSNNNTSTLTCSIRQMALVISYHPSLDTNEDNVVLLNQSLDDYREVIPLPGNNAYPSFQEVGHPLVSIKRFWANHF